MEILRDLRTGSRLSGRDTATEHARGNLLIVTRLFFRAGGNGTHLAGGPRVQFDT